MGRGNRYRRSGSGALNQPKRRHRENTSNDVYPVAQVQRLTKEEEVLGCLKGIFVGTREGVWWQLLPTDDDVSDIEAGTGVPWQ